MLHIIVHQNPGHAGLSLMPAIAPFHQAVPAKSILKMIKPMADLPIKEQP